MTFHLREKDWDELKSNAWMRIVSCDMRPIIKGDPIFLGGEAVVTARRVDPVEKFGLSYVQAFTDVELESNSKILKVSVGYFSPKAKKIEHLFVACVTCAKRNRNRRTKCKDIQL